MTSRSPAVDYTPRATITTSSTASSTAGRTFLALSTTASAIPTTDWQDSSPQSLQIGLGVGLGVGLPFMAMVVVLVVFMLRRRLATKNQDVEGLRHRYFRREAAARSTQRMNGSTWIAPWS